MGQVVERTASGTVVVHVLLRGVTGKASESVPVAGHELVIMGPPGPDAWDEDDMRGSVCEAIVAADESHVEAVLAAVRKDARVVDAWSGSGDRQSTMRRKAVRLPQP